MRSRGFTLLQTLALVVAACGDTGPIDIADDEEDLAGEPRALTASWVNPTCDEAGLSSPANTCDGPWLYSIDPSCVQSSPQCGPMQYQSCAHWAHGWTYKANYTATATRNRACTETCYSSSGECTYSCSSWSGGSDSTWCSNKASDKRSQIDSQVRNAMTAQGISVITQNWALSQLTVTPGSVTLAVGEPVLTVNKPTMQVWKTVYTQTCHMTVSKHPQPAYAADAYCPQIGYPSCDLCPRQDNLISAPGAPRPSADVVAGPVCLTCDGEPVASRAACLFAKLDAPPAGVPAGFRDSIVARLKLHFELHADVFSPAERERVLQLYAAEQGVPVCAAPLPDEELPACAPQLHGVLQACHALTGPHVTATSTASFDAQLEPCLSLLEQAAAISDKECRAAVFEIADELTAKLVERAYAVRIQDGPGAAPIGLEPALDALDRWYAHAAAAAPSADWLQARTSALVKAFWERAYAVAITLPTSVEASTVDTVMAQLTGADMAVDLAVLGAVFSATGTLDSPPLLLITSDALTTTAEKLRFVSIGHDLACRYQTCGGPVAGDATLQLWRALAALHDQPALATALAASPQLQSHHPALFAALAAVRDRHARLDTAWLAAGGTGGIGDLLDAETPPLAGGLRALVGDAASRWSLAQSTGSTTGDVGRVLHAGVQQEAEIRNLLTQREAALTHALEEYQDSKVVLVNAVLAQMQGLQAEESIMNRMESIGLDYIDLTFDLLGLQARETAETARFANVAETFMHLIDSGVYDADVAASQDVLQPLTVNGHDASWSKNESRAPAGIAVRSETMSRGQQLRWSVSGEWAPACALQSSQIPGPTGSTYPAGQYDALTGPEGYRIQWSGSDFESHSSSESTTHTWSNDVKLCASLSLGIPIVDKVLSFGAKLEACTGYSYNKSWSDTDTEGTDSRTSASFSGGLRLPNTPFPQAPAGSLLLVAMSGPRIVDVAVMQRQGTYVAPEEVTVYFVVNDLDDGGCVVRPDALTVEMAKVTSLGAIAGPLSQAMADSLLEIRNQREEILATGTLLPGDATALRSMAMVKVEERVGMSLDALPMGVRAYFNAWLDKELASLERYAQAQSIERQLQALDLELDHLRADLAAARADSRLLALVPRWRARNLALSEIEGELTALIAILERYAPPVFELRYPDERAALLTAAAADLATLRNLDLSGDAEDVVGAVISLSQRVRWALETAQIDLSTEGLTQVALVFPRPAGMAVGCEDFGTCFTSVWRIASQLVDPWFGLPDEATTASGWMTLHVTPEDLYAANGGVARLDCDDHAPVIHRMGLYLVFGDDIDLTPYNLRLPVQVSRRQVFPTNQGQVVYQTARLENSLSVRVTSGLDQNALVRLPATETVGQGLSPFGDFAVNLNALPAEHLRAATSVVLVLELERHRPGPDVALPGVCQALP
jgi:hypothetical protein